MTKNKIAATGFGALIVALTLAGCSIPGSTVAEEPVTPDTSEETPVEEAPETPAEEEEEPAPAPASGDVLQPGDSTSAAGVVPFVNFDDAVANFSHRVTAIESAPQSDVDEIVAEVPQADGFDIYYITVESNYVDGANLEFSAFYSNFSPVNSDLNEVQSIALIGWDNCESNSIPSPGDDPSATIVNCVAALVPNGQGAPVGISWSAFDTEYDRYDGTPAYFLLD